MIKIFVLLSLLAITTAFSTADQVISLDQMPDLSFGLYSGFVSINNTQKQLHYIAALSSGDWKVDPVIVWFNGGPGCSSLLGWAQEHGPYVMEDGTTQFVKNRYAWNQEASVIYLETPAGVGFSTCPIASECIYDDYSSTDENWIALYHLMTQKFTELQNNDLYLAGESYGGIYAPKLAQKIDNYLQNPTGSYMPKLKGFIVGNGVTNWKYDGTPAYIGMSYWYGLIDQTLHENLKTCNLTYLPWNLNQSAQCQQWLTDFDTATGEINIFDVFGICYPTYSSINLYQTKQNHQLKSDPITLKKFYTAQDYAPYLFKSQNNHQLKFAPQCLYSQPIWEYLNTKSVWESLHIPESNQTWEFCVDVNYTRGINGSIDIYEAFKDKNYKILKYSGDTDGAIPTEGTKQWIEELGWEITKPWYTYYVEGQVAGYVETRNHGKFTFATIHGAGHVAPQQKRPQTYHAVFNFIRGDPI